MIPLAIAWVCGFAAGTRLALETTANPGALPAADAEGITNGAPS